MRLSSLIVLCLLALDVESQDLGWHQGVLVFNNLQVLPGRIHHVPGSDLIVVLHGDERLIVQASEFSQLRYYDSASNVNRHFIPIFYRNKYSIFEIIVKGEVSVVRRPVVISYNLSDATGYDYYYVREGRLVDLMSFRKDFYPLIREEVKEFEKLLGLNPNKAADIIRYFRLLSGNWTGSGGMTLSSAW